MGNGFDKLLELIPEKDRAKKKIEVQQSRKQKQQVTAVRARAQPAPKYKGEFHNPYNFIPAVARDTVTGELGDRTPISHSQYLDDYWSGSISVTLTTKTPLLIPDAANAWTVDPETKHQSFPVRMVNGKPYLAPTSIKGMLRSAYEAVTNSRMGVFEDHSDRLAYRMPANSEGLVAGRIEQVDETGKLVFRQLTRAKLKRYQIDSNSSKQIIRDEHTGKWTLNRPGYDRGEQRARQASGYQYWPQNREAIWVQTEESHNRYEDDLVIDVIKRDSEDSPGQNWLKAWAYITGANIDKKQFERVFIEVQGEHHLHKISDTQIHNWEQLIKNYQKEHQKDFEKRIKSCEDRKPDRAKWNQFLDLKKDEDWKAASLQAFLGSEPGKTAWSRHAFEQDSEILKEGDLCHAFFKQGDIDCLLPVMISRQVFESAPEKLIPEGIELASGLSALSPADRVFGWVNQNGTGTHKGQLRIHSVQCDRPRTKAIQAFTDNPERNPGLALNILGQPKPTQTRFYTADADGRPLHGKAKTEGYKLDHQLRGRKVYPHHQNQPNWSSSTDERYARRENGEAVRDSQNRSIQGWVKPNTQFTLKINIINLSDVELGALLWLLELEPDHYHRLGGGKPFGFGSVKLEVASSDLRTGKAWQAYYSSLASEADVLEDTGKLKQAFETALANAYPNDAEHILESFQQMAKGFDDGLPTHYPKLPDGEGEGKIYEWFMQNEQGKRADKRNNQPRRNGQQLALSELWNDPGLPRSPLKP